MPEIVTAHPEALLTLLKTANIPCGEGKKQNILTNCPKEQFCPLPKGEVCVYGIKDIPNMTQIQVLDVFQVSSLLMPMISLFILIFILGMFAGIKLKK